MASVKGIMPLFSPGRSGHFPGRRFHIMKADIHPDYHPVVFQDASSDFSFLTRSTLNSKETIKWEDGETYPLIKMEVSSQSHPFYTGKHKIVDTGGRVDKFRRRYVK
jgi:large subunit ribosomal protein L31